MNLNQVTLPSTDVARGAGFYRRLGFRQIVEDLPSYARFECEAGGATFSLHRVEGRAPNSGAVAYFECADLDATVARLQAAGIAFDAAPQDQPWLWREAYLRDPDGNVLCLYHAGANRRFPPWRLPTPASPGQYTISVEESPSASDLQILSDGLTEHALPATGVAGFEQVAALARTSDGSIVGGAAAFINWNWLFVSILWVAESLRRTGLGHELLATIEELGRRRGCTDVHLDTFSYQARPFYERHGYRVFATLERYPNDHARHFMRKSLAVTE